MSDPVYDDDFNSDDDGKAGDARGAGDAEGKGWEDVRVEELELDSKPLGGGGFALVYRGRWKGKYVAVKTLV